MGLASQSLGQRKIDQMFYSLIQQTAKPADSSLWSEKRILLCDPGQIT